MQRTALVVGATGGIGAAFARGLGRRGFDLALVARNEDRLGALAADLSCSGAVAVRYKAIDLSIAGAVPVITGWLASSGLQPDALVCCAGHFTPVRLAATAWSDDRDYLAAMLLSVCELNHAVLPGMIERRFGRLINVASLLGLLPGVSGHALYCGSKAFLVKFTQSLHLEAQGTGVHVTAVCPGLTDTAFFQANGTRERYQRHTPPWLWQSPEDVADAALAASEANVAVCVPGAQNKFVAALARLLPPSLSLRLARSLAWRFE